MKQFTQTISEQATAEVKSTLVNLNIAKSTLDSARSDRADFPGYVEEYVVARMAHEAALLEARVQLLGAAIGEGDEVQITNVEAWKAADGNYYFHAKAGNGEIVANGEGYSRKADAISAAEAVAPEGVEVEFLPEPPE